MNGHANKTLYLLAGLVAVFATYAGFDAWITAKVSAATEPMKVTLAAVQSDTQYLRSRLDGALDELRRK